MLYNLDYKILLPYDNEIAYLMNIYKLPEISKFIGIDYNSYFIYVTETKNVYYYKIYHYNKLIGAVHMEISNNILDLCILVFPDYQKIGYGKQIIQDVIDNRFKLSFSQIRANIDKSNFASIKLFLKMDFIRCREEDELVEFVYKCDTRK